MFSRVITAWDSANHRQKYAVLALWIVITVVYVSLVGQWIYLSSYDRELGEYLVRVLQVTALQDRSPKEIRELMLLRAEKLSLPLSEGEIHISGRGPTLRAIIRYEADLTLPFIHQPVYRVVFEHDRSYSPYNLVAK